MVPIGNEEAANGLPFPTHQFTTAWEPAPPPAAIPRTPIGRQVAAVLARLREEREGETPRQASAPRKARSRRPGELTISEYAATLGKGPRQLRKLLGAIGLLHTEIEVRDTGRQPPKFYHTARLTPAAVATGLGRRLEASNGTKYDVLTPNGQLWVASKLSETAAPRANSRHAVRETVWRLVQEGHPQADIARLTGLSRQLVSHHARRLSA